MDPLRALVVEDEFLVRLATVDMLVSLGCVVVAEIGNLQEALRLIENTQFDIAILDVNLNGSLVYPAARNLKAIQVPIVFTTGYGIRGIDEEWRTSPILQKPFAIGQLSEAIHAALSQLKRG